MKTRYSLLAAIALLSIAIQATAKATYTFTLTTEPYTELASPTTFPLGTKFTDTLTIPFNFNIAGRVSNKLYISIRGTISTSGKLIDSTRFETFSAEHSQGNYSYEISGTPGDRIMKIQFKNLRFDHDIPGADFMNYQVWLFEKDNTTAIHFGNSSITNPVWSYYYQMGGPAIGTSGAWLTGPPSAPSPDTTTTARLTGTPTNGTVYSFTLQPTGIDPQDAKPSLTIHPIPAGKYLYVDNLTAPATYSIVNTTGVQVQKGTLKDSRVDIQSLHAGQYYLHLSGTTGRQAGFIKL